MEDQTTRSLLNETVDRHGVVKKVFRLYGADGGELNIEYEIHPGESKTRRLIDAKHKIVSEEEDAEGFVQKITTCDEKGVTKDYFIQEKLPEIQAPHKRKAEESLGNSAKKAKSYKVSNEFLELLIRTKVHDLSNWADGGIHVLVAPRNQPAKDTFRSLIENGFLSCPVVSKNDIVYHGFVDLADFIHYFLSDLMKRNEMHTESADSWSVLCKQSSFDQLAVKDLVQHPFSRRNPFHPIRNEYSVFSALEILALEKNLHRIPVLGKNNAVVNLITQSALVKFIVEHMDLLGTIKDKPLFEIADLFHSVFSVRNDCKAVEAFKMICAKNVTGVAIVDESGKLVDNISTRDLKGIDLDGKWWSRLFTTVPEFLASMQQQFPNIKRPKEPIYALPSDTVSSVLRKISEHKIHRVYVVNNREERKPIGVVGLKELLKEILA